jgi:adenine-specific DNA-methyltransferase
VAVPNDPYKALKTTLKAEINEDAWAPLHSNTSRPLDKQESGGCIAIKVINHLSDEIMKAFWVSVMGLARVRMGSRIKILYLN